GVSPTVTTTAVTGGTQVTITDANGPHTFTVLNGVDGQNGQDGQDGAPGADGADGQDGAEGQDGADGVSPTVTTSAVTGGTQVTITDANGPHTFTVLNGVDGQNGQDGQDGAPGADGADGQDADVDFTELTAPTISGGATTITFVAGQRNCVELSTNADLAIALVCNNRSDNYIWITNTHSTTALDVTFSSILFGSTAINDIKGTASIPSIEAGETLEIGIYVTNSKARITSRIL
ncbi:MAG: collagen-like protein, partial [Bacteroidales bacterium]|nr:collagen-like protein [Bacteroidales bacterium]